MEFVRMSQKGSKVAAEVRWITRAIVAPFVRARYTKYLIYYDGPVVDPDTCGAGEGYPDIGPGYAIVFLRACFPLVPAQRSRRTSWCTRWERFRSRLRTAVRFQRTATPATTSRIS